jgi:ribosomal protein S27AE
VTLNEDIAGSARVPEVCRVQSFSIRDGDFTGGGSVAIEMTGGVIVDERGTVVTFRQKCENCGYVFDWNKTTIVPAFSSRKVRPFTCPQCGNYQEVMARHYDPNRQ